MASPPTKPDGRADTSAKGDQEGRKAPHGSSEEPETGVRKGDQEAGRAGATVHSGAATTGPGAGIRGEEGVVIPQQVVPSERVAVEAGPSDSYAVKMGMRRFADSESRAEPEYREIHRQYSEAAEAAVRREHIPLTRRDYIRNYFKAIRPQ